MDLVTFEMCGSYVPLLEFRALIVANGPVINVIQVERAIRLSRNVAAMLNLREKPHSAWDIVWKTVNYIRKPPDRNPKSTTRNHRANEQTAIKSKRTHIENVISYANQLQTPRINQSR